MRRTGWPRPVGGCLLTQAPFEYGHSLVGNPHFPYHFPRIPAKNCPMAAVPLLLTISLSLYFFLNLSHLASACCCCDCCCCCNQQTMTVNGTTMTTGGGGCGCGGGGDANALLALLLGRRRKRFAATALPMPMAMAAPDFGAVKVKPPPPAVDCAICDCEKPKGIDQQLIINVDHVPAGRPEQQKQRQNPRFFVVPSNQIQKIKDKRT